MRYAILIIALVLGMWLLFDGMRAITTGMYTTPGEGEYAGQLGPWSSILQAVGIDPLGMLAKWMHVVLGLAWAGCGLWFFLAPAAAKWPLLITAIASLWYAPFGTLLGIVEIVLLASSSR